jgi:16S rRNA (cytosine1402-N4)-methyltransferase
MPKEVVYYLNCRPGKIFVDGTIGGCGHAWKICEKILPDGLLIGIDQDMDAITNAERTLAPYASNIRLFNGNFIQLPDFLSQLKIAAVDGILLDLGVSLHQIENSGRGFSFRKDESLDMRMDKQSGSNQGKLRKVSSTIWPGKICETSLETTVRNAGQSKSLIKL